MRNKNIRTCTRSKFHYISWTMSSTEELEAFKKRYHLTEDDWNKEISDSHLDQIALEFCACWELLSSHLDLGNTTINDIKLNPALPTETDKRQEFFRQWKRVKGFEATYKKLVAALLRIDQKEEAGIVCKMLKQSCPSAQEQCQKQESNDMSKTNASPVTDLRCEKMRSPSQTSQANKDTDVTEVQQQSLSGTEQDLNHTNVDESPQEEENSTQKAIMHCRESECTVKGDIDRAMVEASSAISEDCNHMHAEGYLCRARAYHDKAQACAITDATETKDLYSKCIQDYIKYYELTKKPECMCLAIEIAVNRDLTHLLSLEEKLNHSECVEIITYMSACAQHVVRWNCKHLSFLIRKSNLPGSGLASTISCDLSSFSWKYLLMKEDLDSETVKAMVSLGANFDGEDFEKITQNISPRNLTVLQLATQPPEDYKKLFLKAVKKCKFEEAQNYVKESQVTVQDLRLSEVLEVIVKGKVHTAKRREYTLFVRKLLEGGINPNDKECPLDVVLKLDPKFYQEERIELLTQLILYGTDIQSSACGRNMIHMAIEWAIESGTPKAVELLEAVCKKFPYDRYRDGVIQDDKGNTPYHIVMKRKKSPNTIKICRILCEHRINPTPANSEGKKPGEGRTKDQQDERYSIMQKAAARFETKSLCKKAEKKKKRPKKHSKAHDPVDSASKGRQQCQIPAKISAETSTVEVDDILSEVKGFLSELSKKPRSYFDSPLEKLPPQVNPTRAEPNRESKIDSVALPPAKEKQKADTSRAANPATQDEVDIVDIAKNFDTSAWEVECTDKVKKFFDNSKIPSHEKESVVVTIKELADGIPLNNPKLSKQVRTSSKLFESRYSDSGRVIFEIAIQFSPRLSEKKDYMYSEVIRIWDIVRDHDNLKRSIDQAVEHIRKSQSRGEKADIRRSLRASKKEKAGLSAKGQEQVRLPQYYVCSKDLAASAESTEIIKFHPAGSTRKDQYNVITFYSFDSTFIRSMLSGNGTRRDFPFKEWPKEHDIISMPQGDVSILLLGRSGTGKTTCCLYRLWNQFQNYWLITDIDTPLLPHRTLDILQGKEEPSVHGTATANDAKSKSSEKTETASEDSIPCTSEPQHFHQVFITKNYVLCAQMKKKFYDLAAGSDIAKDHMRFEDAHVPISLSAVNDLAYPLFLTARQFFLLLDNSLEDNKNFFKRNDDGKLKDKILSSDYDHENPDTLLDLEESDSEDETVLDYDIDEKGLNPKPATDKNAPVPRREVTAQYFTEKIWPHVSKSIDMSDTKIDPLLVWMEIKSFIKGSMRAVEKEEGYLNRDEYEELGKKMAPNYKDRRKEIYKIFELYKNYIQNKCKDREFDECDLNHSLYTRLNALKDLPWSIHSIYVDEVQDFTQAELSILIRICRYPNDLFLTGDTAQSIMRGIAFRFEDLTTIFHRASEQASRSVKSVPVKVPKVDELTINFRSHTGILRLAASIIDLMKLFFPNSFDRLPGDEGMFPGPTPVVLDACHVSDLALVLRSNKRESSTIEFGAHQVIIVQSEEAKKSIPDILKTGIVLTVFESKGLEFDDVLLYDFFKDSKIKEEWRVITSYVEENPGKITNPKGIFGKKPRKLQFNDSLHKSLNAELKYLYTAITRAKCNLWIYDSDEEKRLPVFDYWSKCGLVKVVRISDIQNEAQNTLFSATSSKEEWKAQGDYFKKKRLWEPAMKCYRRAECPHLESEARAYSLVQQARTPGPRWIRIEEIYLKSAHAFLKCDQALHDYEYLENAAKCLKNAKKYKESSELYILLRQIDKAVKSYSKVNNTDYEVLAGLKDAQGNHNDTLRLLLKHNLVLPALQYARKYEMEGIPTLKCYDIHTVAGKHASELVKSDKLKSGCEKSAQELKDVLDFLPPVDQVSHYKSAGMYEKACEILLSEKHYTELYRIYKAQQWHDEGLQLANSQKHREEKELFMLLKATAELTNDKELSDTTVAMLRKKQSVLIDKASLIYGMGTQNYTNIMAAARRYKEKHNPIAYIEAFSLALSYATYDDSSKSWKNINLKPTEDLFDLLLAAHKAITVMKTVLGGAEGHSVQLINQIEEFYGLEKMLIEQPPFDVYCIPSTSYPWTNQLLLQIMSDDAMRDADGMMLFEVDYVITEIRQRIDKIFTQRWIVEDQLSIVKNFITALDNTPLSDEIIASGYLSKSYSTAANVSLEQFLNMQGYAFDIAKAASNLLKMSGTCTAVQDSYVKNQSMVSTTEKQAETHSVASLHISDIVTAVKNVVSPQVTCYMPRPNQIITVRSSNLAQALNDFASEILREDDSRFHFDQWLEAWRISCITKNSAMRAILAKKPDEFANSEVAPPIYVLPQSTEKYQHIMLLWLKTCDMMHESQVMPFCTLAVHNIVRTIATKEILWKTLSISNLLNIVTVHTSALLIMYAACRSRLQQDYQIYLPDSYRQVLSVFYNMISPDVIGFFDPKGTGFFEACTSTVAKRRFDYLPQLPGKILNMLTIIMRVMVGLHNEEFNPLQHALTNENSSKNHEAKHCLAFVLILFGNIGLMNHCPDAQLHSYKVRIYNSLRQCELPLLKQIGHQFSTCSKLSESFDAANKILNDSNDKLTCINFRVVIDPRSKLNKIGLTLRDPLPNIESTFNDPRQMQRRLLPIAGLVSLRPSRPFKLNPEARPFMPMMNQPSLSSLMLNRTQPPNPLHTPPPEQSDFESTEPDEEVIRALKTAEISTVLVTTTQKHPLVNDTYCGICARPLVPDALQQQSSNTTNSPEIYSIHCRGSEHLNKLQSHDLFDYELKNNYYPSKKKLEQSLKECKLLHMKILQDEELTSIIQTIEETLKESKSILENIYAKAEWSRGTQALSTEHAQFESLYNRAEDASEKAEENKEEIEKAKEQEEKRGEQEEMDLLQEDEEEEISKAAPNYGRKEQERKRKEKRKRHERLTE